MSALGRMYPGFLSLNEALTELYAGDFDVPPLPPPDAPSRAFAFWLFMQNFYLRSMPEANVRPIPSFLFESLKNFTMSYRNVTKFPLPFLSANANIGNVGDLLSTAGAGVGGDNWCRHGVDDMVAMEIVRNYSVGGSELEMVCTYPHTTEYEIEPSSNNVRKV